MHTPLRWSHPPATLQGFAAAVQTTASQKNRPVGDKDGEREGSFDGSDADGATLCTGASEAVLGGTVATLGDVVGPRVGGVVGVVGAV